MYQRVYCIFLCWHAWEENIWDKSVFIDVMKCVCRNLERGLYFLINWPIHQLLEFYSAKYANGLRLLVVTTLPKIMIKINKKNNLKNSHYILYKVFRSSHHVAFLALRGAILVVELHALKGATTCHATEAVGVEKLLHGSHGRLRAGKRLAALAANV